MTLRGGRVQFSRKNLGDAPTWVKVSVYYLLHNELDEVRSVYLDPPVRSAPAHEWLERVELVPVLQRAER